MCQFVFDKQGKQQMHTWNLSYPDQIQLIIGKILNGRQRCLFTKKNKTKSGYIDMCYSCLDSIVNTLTCTTL